jgi:hypothetical protein
MKILGYVLIAVVIIVVLAIILACASLPIVVGQLDKRDKEAMGIKDKEDE